MKSKFVCIEKRNMFKNNKYYDTVILELDIFDT